MTPVNSVSSVKSSFNILAMSSLFILQACANGTGFTIPEPLVRQRADQRLEDLSQI